MVNINLTTEKITVKEPRLFKREVVILFAILTILVMCYGAMIIYQGMLATRTSEKNAEYIELHKELTEGNTKEVFDFQNRLNVAKNLISSQSTTFDKLTQIQNIIIPKVYLNSFTYDPLGNQISLSCVADNYDSMAKQILSFKKSGLFSDVILSNSQNTDEGITFPVILMIK